MIMKVEPTMIADADDVDRLQRRDHPLLVAEDELAGARRRQPLGELFQFSVPSRSSASPTLRLSQFTAASRSAGKEITVSASLRTVSSRPGTGCSGARRQGGAALC